MVSDLSYRINQIPRERKPTAASTRDTLFDLQQGLFYIYHPKDCIAHTTVFVKLAGTRNSSMGPYAHNSLCECVCFGYLFNL